MTDFKDRYVLGETWSDTTETLSNEWTLVFDRLEPGYYWDIAVYRLVLERVK